MSAYVCNVRHFDLLADALALAFPLDPYFADRQRVGDLLLRENERSVRARYGDCEPIHFYRYAPTIIATGGEWTHAILSAIHTASRGYTYQSCESDDWQTRPACVLVARLQNFIEAQFAGRKPLDTDTWNYSGGSLAPKPPVTRLDRRSYGHKYEATKTLGLVEVAKLIRADIKSAQKAGSVPAGKASVRTRNGRAIDVTFTPANPRALVCDEYAADLARNCGNHDHVSHFCGSDSPCRAVQYALDAIHAAYNYDGSDSQTDYFDVRYYGGARIAGIWQATEARAADLRRVESADVAR